MNDATLLLSLSNGSQITLLPRYSVIPNMGTGYAACLDAIMNLVVNGNGFCCTLLAVNSLYALYL